jgi:hypothetical protein
MQLNKLAPGWAVAEVTGADRAQSRVVMVRALQKERGAEACFLTEKRLFCQDADCEWRKECCRLVAVWRR